MGKSYSPSRGRSHSRAIKKTIRTTPPFLAKILINTIKLRSSRANRQLCYRPRALKVHKYSGHNLQNKNIQKHKNKKHRRNITLQSSSLLVVSSLSLAPTPFLLASSSPALSPSRFPSASSLDKAFIRISSLLFLLVQTLIISSKVLQVSFSSARIHVLVVDLVGFWLDVMTISGTCFPMKSL